MIKRPLQLEILITTGYQESGDTAKDDCLRIDQTSYYLNAIFWAMNTASKGQNLLELETDHQLFTFPEFLQNVEHLSEIGIGLVEQMTTYSIALVNSKTSEAKPNINLSTAEMISHLINNESVPDKISEALSYAVTDIFNHLPSDSAAQNLERTPEYIEAVLTDYEKNKEVKND